jgi:hypothetical protein
MIWSWFFSITAGEEPLQFLRQLTLALPKVFSRPLNSFFKAFYRNRFALSIIALNKSDDLRSRKWTREKSDLFPRKLGTIISVLSLRVCAKISLHSGASAGRVDARRRDAGDVVHLRIATTPQMPARRRAPQGCRLSELQYSMSASRRIIKPESRQRLYFHSDWQPVCRFPTALILRFSS